MPKVLVKASPDEDLFVIWLNDAPLAIGTRKELENFSFWKFSFRMVKSMFTKKFDKRLWKYRANGGSFNALHFNAAERWGSVGLNYNKPGPFNYHDGEFLLFDGMYEITPLFREDFGPFIKEYEHLFMTHDEVETYPEVAKKILP
jgi:hypothetical protein